MAASVTQVHPPECCSILQYGNFFSFSQVIHRPHSCYCSDSSTASCMPETSTIERCPVGFQTQQIPNDPNTRTWCCPSGYAVSVSEYSDFYCSTTMQGSQVTLAPSSCWMNVPQTNVLASASMSEYTVYGPAFLLVPRSPPPTTTTTSHTRSISTTTSISEPPPRQNRSANAVLSSPKTLAGVIVGSILGGIIVLILVVAGIFRILQRRKRRRERIPKQEFRLQGLASGDASREESELPGSMPPGDEEFVKAELPVNIHSAVPVYSKSELPADGSTDIRSNVRTEVGDGGSNSHISQGTGYSERPNS